MHAMLDFAGWCVVLACIKLVKIHSREINLMNFGGIQENLTPSTYLYLMRYSAQNKVRPKKSLGQHFLNDQNVARKIVDGLESNDPDNFRVLEIGPGMGVLTRYLTERKEVKLRVVEIDRDSVAYLKKNFPGLDIIEGDFLELDLSSLFAESFSVIGNFPYNISSQIFFKVLDYRDRVDQVVCMLQKEVADRIASKEGNKTYGS
jgi:16S rRNA (adenine1518-N6/adenine1519-N6)-dimethyltransferase